MMLRSKPLTLLSGLISVLSLNTVAAPPNHPASTRIVLAASNTEVEFLATGRPSAIKVRGKAGENAKETASGSLTLAGGDLTGSAKYQLDSFDTGLDLRTKHMKEKYLETSKYPSAELTLEKLSLPPSCGQGDCSAEDLPFAGKLAFHGSSQPLTGKVSVKRSAKNIELLFDFKLKLSDFKIEPPSFMGISINDDVTVSAKVRAATEL